ncbi:hypothetical protein VHEMI02269 [[Torrubiella] hemipterigena]|uniref:Uncharacterized protein n=1 Tax=[Torrubiella] hemipterigena TaxID=1531966 RepID=A0A0A1T7E0_9HYPO|nr:hypothetical protein VHEMI02269 [[Torrubiella] hemipterigena]
MDAVITEPAFTNGIGHTGSMSFYHIVDETKRNLTIYLLGPNIQYTFKHREQSKHGVIADYCLARKTAGFLAEVLQDGSRRIVKWAESGHGQSLHGDALIRTPYALKNSLWAARATQIAKLFGFNTRCLFDGNRWGRTDYDRKKGAFFGAHVEVKLSTHAVWAWLVGRKIIGPGEKEVTYQQIASLKTASWSAERPLPHYDIYFSRHPCSNCINFVNKLSEVSGIPMLLHWRQRLTEMTYGADADFGTSDDLGSSDEEYRQPEQQEIVVLGGGPEKTIGLQTPQKQRMDPKDPRSVEKPLPPTPVKKAPFDVTYNRSRKTHSWFREASIFL